MKTSIALATAILAIMGINSAYADGGNIHSDTQFTDLPGVIAHAPHSVASVAKNNMGHAVSFMTMGGQYALPPGYTPHYDRANHVVTLRYAGPMATNKQQAGHAVSFMAMGGQYTFPPGYTPSL